MSPRDVKPVYTDRPGEAYPSRQAAARALGLPPTSIAKALAEGRPYAGRKWSYGLPPQDVAAAEAAERQRAASVRCHPGRNGKVENGTDARTGTVYVNGKPAAPAQAGRALAGLAKGAAA